MVKAHIVIPGKPIAKKRPRFYHRGAHFGAYNCQMTEEGRWIIEAKQATISFADEGTPIALKCWFYFDFPKSMSAKKRAGAVYTKKPDLDNLVKFVKDCLNGVAWKDDSQVVSLMSKKLYDFDGIGARTEIIIATPEAF